MNLKLAKLNLRYSRPTAVLVIDIFFADESFVVIMSA